MVLLFLSLPKKNRSRKDSGPLTHQPSQSSAACCRLHLPQRQERVSKITTIPVDAERSEQRPSNTRTPPATYAFPAQHSRLSYRTQGLWVDQTHHQESPDVEPTPPPYPQPRGNHVFSGVVAPSAGGRLLGRIFLTGLTSRMLPGVGAVALPTARPCAVSTRRRRPHSGNTILLGLLARAHH